MIHGCKSLAYNNVPNADIIVPVSKAVIETYGNELKSEKVKPILNAVSEIPNKKVLKLVSCTRLTKEKGYNRMTTLANKLREADIPYI